MPTQILPAASLRSANRLPAGRTPSWTPNCLIRMRLWALSWANFRAVAHFLPDGRELPPRRPLSAGDGEVVDPEGRGIGAGLEFEIVGGDEAGEDVLEIAGHRHLADREGDLALV